MVSKTKTKTGLLKRLTVLEKGCMAWCPIVIPEEVGAKQAWARKLMDLTMMYREVVTNQV